MTTLLVHVQPGFSGLTLLLGSSVKFYCLMIERFHFTGTELTNLGNTWRKRQDGALLTGIIANRVLFHDEPFVLPLVRSLCLTIWLCHFSRLDVELLLNFICSEKNYWSVCIPSHSREHNLCNNCGRSLKNKFRTSTGFLCNCINRVHNCKDHSSFDFISAVLMIYFIYICHKMETVMTM